MDAVKLKLAKAVQGALHDRLSGRTDIEGLALEMTEDPSTPLVTSFRVRTPTGVRYFTITLREHY